MRIFYLKGNFEVYGVFNSFPYINCVYEMQIAGRSKKKKRRGTAQNLLPPLLSTIFFLLAMTNIILFFSLS